MTRFRFYAELCDFLPAPLRGRELSYVPVAAPSVKDAIESFGVPHTEVDLVLVDGESVGFGQRLTGAELVSVYPAFERIDISRVTRVRPDPLDELRFVADGHLGTLARFLRLLGFDTRYDSVVSDEALAEAVAGERRILLTRDRGLLKRSIVTHGLFVRDDNPDRQLDDVVRRLRLGSRLRPFTRCMACNGSLEPVAKDQVLDRLLPRTRDTVDAFQRCRGCDQLYWQGSHHARLAAIVARAQSAGARPHAT